MIGNNSIYNDQKSHYDKYEFIRDVPELAIPCLVLLTIASVVGTIGNILILLIVWRTKELRQTQSIFIVNLAFSDLYITLIADPMSIVGKIIGRNFFDEHPILCQIVGKTCTISCISSLGSIALLSLNRYIYICHNSLYTKIFDRWVCIGMCVCLYCIGLTLVMLNLAGIGDHNFDDKSLECIWDRQATYSYTVIFSVSLVWIPLIIVGMSYLNLFRYVRVKLKPLQNEDLNSRQSYLNNVYHVRLARTIFIIYTIFSLCWIPFAVLLVADVEDTFPAEVHLCITVFAHFHPSINWLIYILTNNRFKTGFKKLFRIDKTITLQTGMPIQNHEMTSSAEKYTAKNMVARCIQIESI